MSILGRDPLSRGGNGREAKPGLEIRLGKMASRDREEKVCQSGAPVREQEVIQLDRQTDSLESKLGLGFYGQQWAFLQGPLSG